ncbi:hypothetical protein AB0T83_14850 [Fluviibacterium sp. DFM31]|uniref:Uncharacterized protein n=1 Tax=Meridianimarinicoccus marinus TaxID=3231483 RepID=A0ABV3L967_9RHOB
MGQVDRLSFNGKSIRVEGWCRSEGLVLDSQTGSAPIIERFPIAEPDPSLCLGARNTAGFRQDLVCSGGVVQLSVQFGGHVFVYELANL